MLCPAFHNHNTTTQLSSRRQSPVPFLKAFKLVWKLDKHELLARVHSCFATCSWSQHTSHRRAPKRPAQNLWCVGSWGLQNPQWRLPGGWGVSSALSPRVTSIRLVRSGLFSPRIGWLVCSLAVCENAVNKCDAVRSPFSWLCHQMSLVPVSFCRLQCKRVGSFFDLWG